MLQDEVRVLGLMRPSPAPPKADLHQVQYEPAPIAAMQPPRSAHTPPGPASPVASPPSATAGAHGPHHDLVHGLSVLSEQGRPDPTAQQRSWRGMVFPAAGPSPPPAPALAAAKGAQPTPVSEHEHATAAQSRSSPRPIPSLARSYTEGCIPRPASPPMSPWSRFRQRFGSLSQSHIPQPQEREEYTHFTGSGWNRHHRRSYTSSSPTRTSMGGDGSGFSGSERQIALPPADRHHSRRRRRTVSEVASCSPRSPGTSGSPRLHRHALLPINGAPGFSPHEHATFGGAAAATWAAEELAREAERKRGIPVRLVGRASDDDDASGEETQPARSEASESVVKGPVSPALAASLQARLPPRLRLGNKWQLVYSLDQHGVSLKTMYGLARRFFNTHAVRHASEQAPGPFALLDKELSSKLNTSKEADIAGSTTDRPSPDSGRPLPRRHVTEPVYPSSSNSTPDPADPAAPGLRHLHHHLGAAVADRSRAGLVLAIRDMEGHVFGAFLDAHLHVAPHYYGTGESFLWKVARNAPLDTGAVSPVSKDQDQDQDQGRNQAPDRAEGHGYEPNQDEVQPGEKLVVYRWTGQNDFIILSEAHFLSVGFGASSSSQGGYGLWVDDEFARGSSARCATFDNDVLCSPSVPTRPARPGGREEECFECFQVELWAVGLSS